MTAHDEFIAAMQELMSYKPFPLTIRQLRKLAVAFFHVDHAAGGCSDCRRGTCEDRTIFLRDCGLEADDERPRR